MVDEVIQPQELTNARIDAKTYEVVVLGGPTATVVNRAGNTLPSVEKFYADREQQIADAIARKPYSTVALMNADPDSRDKIAIVTSDPDPLLNGNYEWKEGAGWHKTGLQPVSSAELAETDALAREALQKADAVPVLTEDEEDALLLTDPQERIALRVKATAVHEIPSVKLTGKAASPYSLDAGQFKLLSNGSQVQFGEVLYDIRQNEEYFIAYVDAQSRVAFGIKWTGETVIGFTSGYATAKAFSELSARVLGLENGSGGGTATRNPPIVGYVSGTQVKIFEFDGSESVALDLDELVNGISEPHIRLEADVVLALINRGYFSSRSPAAISVHKRPDGSHLVIDASKKICYVVPSVGQSNSVGSRGNPPDIPLYLSGEYGNSLMMLDGPVGNGVRLTYGSQSFNPALATRLVPMRSMVRRGASDPDSYGLGTTHVEGMGFRLAYEFRKNFGFDPFMVMFTAGMGGKLYDELKKGTLAHNNMLAAIQRIKELVEPDGYTVVVPFVAIVHGESDANRKTYQQGILDWQNDMESDIRAITGQTSNIPCICSQASTYGKLSPDRQILGSIPSNQSAMGRVIWGVYSTYLACKSRTTHHMAGAYYPLEFSDDYLHLSKYGHAMNGEYIAITAMATVFGTKDHGAIMLKSVTFNGTNSVDIEFDVPVAPLVRNLSVTDPGAWGFEFFDGDGWSMSHPERHPGVATTVELVGPSTIRITCSVDIPAGAQRSIGYALQGWAAPKQPGEGSRGQICDSSPEVSLANGQPLPNWMPHFLEFF